MREAVEEVFDAHSDQADVNLSVGNVIDVDVIAGSDLSREILDACPDGTIWIACGVDEGEIRSMEQDEFPCIIEVEAASDDVLDEILYSPGVCGVEDVVILVMREKDAI